MRQVVQAIDASITEFDDYSTRDAEAPTKYPNFAKSAITGLGDQLSYLKMELLDTYTIALQALATQCGTKTNVEAVLDGHISGKTNIVVVNNRNSLAGNFFDDFVRGANDLLSGSSESSDLEMVGPTHGARLKEFQLMFEVAPRYGEELLNSSRTFVTMLATLTLLFSRRQETLPSRPK